MQALRSNTLSAVILDRFSFKDELTEYEPTFLAMMGKKRSSFKKNEEASNNTEALPALRALMGKEKKSRLS